MELVNNFKDFDEAEKKHYYLRNLKPVVLKDALFADETKDYVQIFDEKVILYFRTAKNNVDKVFLILDDRKLEMKKTETEGLFDYYQIEVDCPKEVSRYYFEAVSGRMSVCFDKQGAKRKHSGNYDFRIIPGFHTPDWAKGAVFYQIFVDRFYNGDPENDVQNGEYVYINQYVRKVDDWNALPQVSDVRRFYGGDLQGIMDKLDYLQELGVDVLYLNPIFVSPSNHKYDIQDYDYVDPHYGKIVYDGGQCLEDGEKTNEKATKYAARVTETANLEASNHLLVTLIEELHRRGMKIVLDGVFNHCGSFNKWMDREKLYDKNPAYSKGAYISESSPFKKFFTFNGGKWPENGEYTCWWGHETLPKLNYECRELYDYILGIAQKWLSPPYNIDGWRVDVAADLGPSQEVNHLFWKDFRKAVKQINPEAIILAEHYGDASAWLQGDEWDTVMNYDAFMEPLTWMLTGMEKHSDEYREDLYGNSSSFMESMIYHMNAFHSESLYVAMNELSNHDHSRFLTRTNHRVGRLATAGSAAASEDINYGIFREAVVAQMTWPGAPTLYYGDEAGVCGWTDPDNRRTYPWGMQDKGLLRFHKDIIHIHKKYEVLKTGSFRFLDGGRQWISFGRFNRKEQMVVILNNDEKTKTVTVPVWYLGVSNDSELESVIYTSEKDYHMRPMYWRVAQGCIRVTMEKYSALVLRAK